MQKISPSEYADRVAAAVQHIDPWQITNIVKLIQAVKDSDGMVFTMGNGGSAATASHFANDLTKAASVRAMCLPDAVPLNMAYMNDDGAENMFVNALKKFFRPGDLVFTISCSGTSPNVVKALEANFGISVLLTGNKGESAYASAVMRAYDDDIRVQEDVHSVICHAITASLRDG